MLSQRAKSESGWLMKQFDRQIKRQTGIEKPFIDLSTAENWMIRDEVIAIVKAAIKHDFSLDHMSYSYGMGGPEKFLAAASKFFNHFFDPKRQVKPEHIITGAGCSAVLSSLIYDLCDSGDGLLIEAPYWGSFKISAVIRNGVNLVEVRVPSEQYNAETVVEHYEQAMDQASCRIKGILFCNPHNPTAQVYSSRIIQALLRFCEEKKIHFISDEIYALSTFRGMDVAESIESDESDQRYEKQKHSSASETGPNVFVSVLHMDLEKLKVNPARVHMLYGISKDFGCSGLRLGFCITQSNPDLRTSLALLNVAGVSNVTYLMASAILSDLTNVVELLDKNRSRLETAISLVIRFLNFHHFTFVSPVGGIYIWAKLGGDDATWEKEADMHEACMAAGVLIGQGFDYSANEPGWFRLTFSVPQRMLRRALDRIERALRL